ncbi:MAG: hypothetical protein RLN81_14430, partial [Balneolaceae bacterium]
QLGFPEWIAPFVTILVLIGFPLALIFAWAFELTPDGIQKSNEVEITESVTTTTGKKLNGIIITVLSMAVIFLVVERVFFAKASILENAGDAAEVETASIAVLPFVNMSSDEENEFFSDGLSEELLNALAKVEDMQVAGRTSSFKFKGQNENLTLIGEELGVANILEGSVRKSEERVRITAQLIRVEDGFHMWSETFDRELNASNIFDIQEEISRMVMQELKIRLLPEEDIQLTARPTQDIEAYNAYLAATQLESSRNAADIELAITKYQDAIRIDPSFALAYAELSLAYNLLLVYGNAPRQEITPLIKENADKAIQLDANLGRAYQALADFHISVFEAEIALETNSEALMLLPNDVEVWNQRHTIFEMLQDREKGMEALTIAYELDPLNPPTATNYANHIRNDDRYEEAIEIYDRIINAYPRYSLAYSNKAIIYRDSPYGDLVEAFKYMYTAYEQSPNVISNIDEMHEIALDLDYIELASFFSDEAVRLFQYNPASYSIRMDQFLVTGQYEQAEQLIEQAISVFGDQIRPITANPLAPNLYYLGKYQEGIDLYHLNYPLLKEEEPVLNRRNYNQAYLYASFLKASGNTERYQLLADTICEYVEESYNGKTDLEIQERSYYEELSNCFALQGDVEKAMEYHKKIFYEFNSVANLLRYQKRYFYNDFISDDPLYKETYTAMYTEIHKQRDQVVSYMKEEGFWQEEWEVEIKD